MLQERDGRLRGAVGERRLHLAALNAAVADWDGPLACALVNRDGALVLNVVNRTDEFRSLDVGCERVGGVWWFVRTDTGEGLVPVLEVADAPALLARVIERAAGDAAGSGGR
ncbi:hypothetical protein [Actinomadura chokoriensis]|uniref:Diguanylate cyclase n=1 Tax=Actinomadura chokoriensis TaxID=454156 RepID=A0ABV4R3L4_9ACTN